jgi:hypothetical protein
MIFDTQGLRVFLLFGQRDHLRRDVDAYHVGGPPTLEAATAHPVTASQIED